MKLVSNNKRCSGRDFNPAPPECEAVARYVRQISESSLLTFCVQFLYVPSVMHVLPFSSSGKCVKRITSFA
jgi:hypothetical protein